ncbi:MAG: transglycosylase domain-containing protein [Candidatus Woesearchaeota archaeon]
MDIDEAVDYYSKLDDGMDENDLGDVVNNPKPRGSWKKVRYFGTIARKAAEVSLAIATLGAGCAAFLGGATYALFNTPNMEMQMAREALEREIPIISERGSQWDDIHYLNTLTGSPGNSKTSKRQPELAELPIGVVQDFIDSILDKAGISDVPILSDTLDPAVPDRRLEIFDESGNLIYCNEQARQIRIPLEEVSQSFLDALIAVEDKKFYDHQGIDKPRLAKATYQYFNGDSSQGASTITQQLVKILFQENERTLKRKIEQNLIAAKMELRFSKYEILQAYCNWVHLGENNYGIEAASQDYFGKNAKDLSLGEAGLLVAMIPAPARYKLRSEEGLKEAIRRLEKVVFPRMLSEGMITQQENDAALEEALNLSIRKKQKRGYCSDIDDCETIVTRVTQEARQLFGKGFEDIGMKITTTIQPGLQSLVKSNLRTEVEKIIRASQVYSNEFDHPQGCSIVLNPFNGDILAAVGNTGEMEIGDGDRCNIPRQPGSSIKPFVYAWAIDNHYIQGPDDAVFDIYMRFGKWTPHNYDYGFMGKIPVRVALAKSRNCASINTLAFAKRRFDQRFLEKFGGDHVKMRSDKWYIEESVNEFLDFLTNLGFMTLSEQDRTLPIAVGGFTYGIKPIESAHAYSAFINNGNIAGVQVNGQVRPTSIRSVEIDGEKYMMRRVQCRVFSEITAQDMVDIMNDSVDKGTCIYTRQFVEMDKRRFKVPTAGKTGTTNNWEEAWQIIFYTHASNEEGELQGPERLLLTMIAYDQNEGRGTKYDYRMVKSWKPVTGSYGPGRVNKRLLDHMTEQHFARLKEE